VSREESHSLGMPMIHEPAGEMKVLTIAAVLFARPANPNKTFVVPARPVRLEIVHFDRGPMRTGEGVVFFNQQSSHRRSFYRPYSNGGVQG